MSSSKKRTKLEAYEEIRSSIMTLGLAPGMDIDENTLAQSFGLSRTPLREILMRLAGEGYVELRENRGFRVSAMSHTTLRDFFLAAPMVYSAILRLASQNATKLQIDALKAAQSTFQAALRSGSVSDRAMANNRFHEITGDMADNPYLSPSFKRLLIDHARIGMTFYQPSDAEMVENLTTASQQHDAIIAAIEARDETSAGQLAVDHWNLSRNQIEIFVMPNALDIPLGTTPDETPSSKTKAEPRVRTI